MSVHIYIKIETHNCIGRSGFQSIFTELSDFIPPLALCRNDSSFFLLQFKELRLRQAKRFAQNDPKMEEQNSKLGFWISEFILNLFSIDQGS